jgi:hypothetical protein
MVFLLVFATTSRAQTSFKSLRYNEDHSYLRNDSSKNSYKKFKFTSFNNQRSLSMGGEVRYLMQNFVNEDWGDFPVREYTAFYSRFLFHTDLRLSNSIRGFVQFNSTFANGRVTPIRSIDENRFSIHQAFVDVQVAKPLLLRVGRQELLYGSQRLISVREGPNNRLSFDAAKMIVRHNNILVDFFYARPVAIRADVLDDEFNETQSLWGGYAALANVPTLKNIDFYYLGYDRQQARFDDGVADELRHSLGTRWWGKVNRWEYDIEALYQAGSFGSGSISAWTASLNTSYTFTEWKKPVTAGIKTEIISGDRNRNDGQLNTFNPLFPRGAYFGLAALYRPFQSHRFSPLR